MRIGEHVLESAIADGMANDLQIGGDGRFAVAHPSKLTARRFAASFQAHEVRMMNFLKPPGVIAHRMPA
jgi:hypothetical protein